MCFLFCRRPDFVLHCSCVEKCWERNHITCKINVTSRKSCKYCRYTRCQKNAGMVKNWVLSAHIPIVEKDIHFQLPDEKGTNVKDSQGQETKKTSLEISLPQEKGSIQKLINGLNQACLVDLKVVKGFKGYNELPTIKYLKEFDPREFTA